MIALAMALIGLGVVLLVALGNSSGGAPAVSPRDSQAQGPSDDEAVDITAVGGTTDARIQIEDKKRPGRIQAELLFSRLDPIGQGVYDVRQPRAWIFQPDGRTIYVRADEGTIKLPSRSDAPESGEFRGEGLVLMFPAREPGDSRPIDVEQDTPSLVARFTAASFDTVLLEATSKDRIEIQTPESSASFVGLFVRANQVEERIEVARLGPGTFRYRTERDKPAAAPAEPDTDTPAPEPRRPRPPRSAQPLEPTAPEEPARQTLYRTVFTGGVTLNQASREMVSDTLRIWTRLIDNKLPEGALGEVERSATASAATPAHAPTASASATPPMPLRAAIPALAMAQSSPATAPRALFTERQADVILTWQGEVNLAPLANDPAPPQLSDGNHVFASFTAEAAGGESRVTMLDAATGAIGACGQLDYAATTRELALLGADKPGLMDRIDLTVPAAGRVVGPRLTLNLASGIGQVPGAGVLLSWQSSQTTVMPEADPDAPIPAWAERRISWSDQADFEFFTRDGQAEDVLKAAAFTGDVLALDQSSMLAGDFLRAEFQRVESAPDAAEPAKKPRARSIPSRLRIEGRALAVGGPSPRRMDADRPLPPFDPYIAGDEIDVLFAPVTLAAGDATRTESVPTAARASGNVFVADRTSSLAAASLVAELIQKRRDGQTSGSGDTTVGDVLAEGRVRITREGGVWAEADKLVASADERWAHLTGESVALGRADESVIRGPVAHLEESIGLLHIFGPGSFEHLQPSDAAMTADPRLAAIAAAESPPIPAGLSRLRTTWTDEMSFTNLTGRIECRGGVEATVRSAVEGQTALCEHLLMHITPAALPDDFIGPPPEQVALAADAAAGSGNAGPSLGAGMIADLGDRQLLRAEMIGGAGEPKAPASVKSWKYGVREAASPDGVPERVFDQVFYIESSRLIGDERRGVITAPDRGRALMFDAGRGGSASDSAASGRGPEVQAAGDTRLTWAERMTFDRGSGQVRLLQEVEVEHLPLGESEKLVLRCPDLLANFDMGRGAGGRLLSATAEGGALASSGPRQLTADRFTYDATIDTLTALSVSDTPVMVTDTRLAAPTLARKIRWDRRTDRIEVLEPMPISVPLRK